MIETPTPRFSLILMVLTLAAIVGATWFLSTRPDSAAPERELRALLSALRDQTRPSDARDLGDVRTERGRAAVVFDTWEFRTARPWADYWSETRSRVGGGGWLSPAAHARIAPPKVAGGPERSAELSRRVGTDTQRLQFDVWPDEVGIRVRVRFTNVPD